MRKSYKFIALAFIVSAAMQSQATIIMDQIGANPADMTGAGSASQEFEASFAAYQIGAIDDFNTTSAANIINVDVVMLGYGASFTANSWNQIRGFNVDVYSSVAAGAANLIGDQGHVVVLPNAVTFQDPYYPPGFLNRIYHIPVNIAIGAGNHWIGIRPQMDFTGNGQTGILQSTYAAGFPNGSNGMQINPGLGFGLGNPIATNANLAYRINANLVPEPVSMIALGAGALALVRRRRNKS